MTRGAGNTAAAALILGAAHALVDLGCAFVLFRDLNAAGVAPATVATWIIVYDALGFGLQAPLGLWIDRWRSYRGVSLLGMAAVALALAVGLVSPRAAAVIAGIGNALFHAGAGGHVLRSCGNGATSIGLFVGPGAIGLCLGILGGSGQAPYRLAIAAALAVALLAVARAMSSDQAREVDARSANRLIPSGLPWLCLGLLLVTVTLRSTIGDNLVSDWREQSTDVVVALAVVATVGKMLGGAVADRFGWIGIGGGALVMAAPIVAVGRLSPVAAVLGMLLLQVTTPLTLKAIHRLVPDRPGLAFGIPSAALLVGAAPGLFDVWLPAAWPVLLGATLLSALAVVAGLRLLERR